MRQAPSNEFCDWSSELYRSRDAELHRHQLRLRARSHQAVARRAASWSELGGFGTPRPEGRVVLRRRAAAAHLQLPVDVRRPGARTRRSRCTRSSPTWTRSRACSCPQGGMHAMAAGLARAVDEAGVEIRYELAGHPHPARRRRRGHRRRARPTRERVAADAVVCNADLPVAYRTLLGGVDAPRAARRGTYSPSCLLWVAGVRGSAARERRPPQHPLRQASGTSRSRRSSTTGCGCPTRRCSSRCTRSTTPAWLQRAVRRSVRPRAGAQPRRQGRLGARA